MLKCATDLEVLGNHYSFSVRWKHMIVSFYVENNRKSATLKFVISLIALTICISMYKMFCRLEKLDENEEDLKAHLIFVKLCFCNTFEVQI